MNPDWLISKPALIIYAVIAGIGLYNAWAHHIASEATTACQNTQKVASVELKASAATAGTTAVEGVANDNKTDAPAVDVAANGVRNACRVRNTTSPAVSHGASGQAENSGESQAQADAAAEAQRDLDDAADDIRTCQSELNRFTGLQRERAALTAITHNQ